MSHRKSITLLDALSAKSTLLQIFRGLHARLNSGVPWTSIHKERPSASLIVLIRSYCQSDDRQRHCEFIDAHKAAAGLVSMTKLESQDS